MKIRIDLPAFALFNGKMSGVQFQDGVSVRDVTDKEARKIGINVRIVDAETGEQVGLRKPVNDIRAAPLKTVEHATEAELEAERPEPPIELPPIPQEELRYSREYLETVADEKGMKGIREIAKEYDVKGVQIAQMIEDILKAQGA